MNIKDISFRLKTANLPKVIKRLSVAALLFAVFASLSYFIDIDYNSDYSRGKLILSFPDFLNFMIAIFHLLPFILFALYVVKYYKKPRGAVLVPAIFAAMAIEALLSQIWFSKIYYGESYHYYRYHSVASEAYIKMLLLVSLVAAVIAFIGVREKGCMMFAVGMITAINLGGYMTGQIGFFGQGFEYADWVEQGWWLLIFCDLAQFFSILLFGVALFLFVFRYRLRPIKEVF